MVSGLGSSFCRLVDGPASRDLSDDDFFDRRVTDFLLANSGSVNLTLDIRLMRRQMANIESFTGCRLVDWRSLPEHRVSSLWPGANRCRYRSETRRVGDRFVRKGRSRWGPAN